ncbi:serine protease [Planctomycetota bacterium]|nr:serine protease [Planctomycetota bacterium]
MPAQICRPGRWPRFSAVALLLLACSAATAAADDDRTALAVRLLRSYAFVGQGSGVFVGSDGWVLTNHHVSGEIDASDLRVRLAGADHGFGRSLPAKLLGFDPIGDLALLQVDAGDWDPADPPWTPAPLAPAEALVAGAPVVAVGNPFGLGTLDDVPTVTWGVLSTGRVVRGGYLDAVQGDAPVNPGNSGGPLFDGLGRLLGINGQIRSRTGMRINSGIGLAIASTQIATLLPALAAADGGAVRRTGPPLGVTLAATADGRGVEISAVADEAVTPLRPGDRLLAIDGRRPLVPTSAEALFRGRPWALGATMAVQVRRAGQTVDLVVPVGRTALPGRPWHGWTVAERTLVGERQIFLETVTPDSPAAKAGLAAGDRLLTVNGQTVASRIDVLRAMVGVEPGDRVAVQARSSTGDEKSVTVRIVGRE